MAAREMGGPIGEETAVAATIRIMSRDDSRDITARIVNLASKYT
jgi:hypothetical protein